MPGYASVQSWFVQAVPALSKYMTVGDSHTVTCRLKVVSPTNSLHVKNENGKARHYLGFQKDDVVSPCQNTTDTTIINGQCPNFWIRLDYTVERRLFEPQTFRAPVLRGFDNYDVGGSKFGSQYSEAFAAVTWDIIAPFADVLAHGTRIILRARPTDDKAPVSHMTVFRTAQGEFVPGMSDRDKYQYWRLLKAAGEGSTAPQPGEPIQAGDEIRLAWSFKDQTTGYRDYVDDVFGRRQTNPPTGEMPVASGSGGDGEVLYLKVPWPRFENTGRPTAMIMCADESTKEIVKDVQTARGRFKYALQDVRFRLDAVPNGGKGDSEDCEYILPPIVFQPSRSPFLSLLSCLGSYMQRHCVLTIEIQISSKGLYKKATRRADSVLPFTSRGTRSRCRRVFSGLGSGIENTLLPKGRKKREEAKKKRKKERKKTERK